MVKARRDSTNKVRRTRLRQPMSTDGAEPSSTNKVGQTRLVEPGSTLLEKNRDNNLVFRHTLNSKLEFWLFDLRVYPLIGRHDCEHHANRNASKTVSSNGEDRTWFDERGRSNRIGQTANRYTPGTTHTHGQSRTCFDKQGRSSMIGRSCFNDIGRSI